MRTRHRACAGACIAVHQRLTGVVCLPLVWLGSCSFSRPGILVLINDTDWELEDGLDYQIKAGDVLTFISTLHGG